MMNKFAHFTREKKKIEYLTSSWALHVIVILAGLIRLLMWEIKGFDQSGSLFKGSLDPLNFILFF